MAVTETLQANAIIDALKSQANQILSAALGSTPLEAFNIGSEGNYPYYWQDPRNLQFNAKTYGWISGNLKAGASPLQFDAVFTNLYIRALSSVSYSLSSADQAKLNAAAANATQQQTAVLNAWNQAFGSLPSGPGQPIDNIAAEIATQWAQPPTTLNDIKNAININQLLNNVPASGAPVVPVFANWLNALGEAVSLENNVTMNNAYVARALAAAQTPTAANGGLQLDNNIVSPAYNMATQLSAILNGLKNTQQACTLQMDVSRSSESEYQVRMSGGTQFAIPVLDFLTLKVGANANYFHSDMATSSNSVSVKMTFPGVTLVNFGPADFTQSPPRYWFWMEPIREAIQNTGKDTSSFKFSPDPQIDFSDNGPFAYLMGVAISNYPSMEITVKGANYQFIQTTFQQSASVGISFLGIPLGIGGSESSYSNNVSTNASQQSVTIKLNPPPELVAGNQVDSVGWVLGVQPNYPAD